MALTLQDHQRILRGFSEDPAYVCLREAAGVTNPVHVSISTNAGTNRFRLWAFSITHGGGEARDDDEFRIQITNGPTSLSSFNSDGAIDLLIGYSSNEDVIVAYDIRWLERWTAASATGRRKSPSIQIKRNAIRSATSSVDGSFRLTKSSDFSANAGIVALTPPAFARFLLDPVHILNGQSAMPTALKRSSEEVTSLAQYCQSRGFSFKDDLLARYLAALATKPFVILGGTSGTGKSKLATLVAEFYSLSRSSAPPSLQPTASAQSGFEFSSEVAAVVDPERSVLIPVRPDWTDNHALLGYRNPITNEYESTQALEMLLRASRSSASGEMDADKPYFILLDEMNLARVEYYFSDWLACLESRRVVDEKLSSEPIPLHRSAARLTTFILSNGARVEVEVPPNLEIPSNVVITGTINVDETTHSLSPKVLDRAMVLEFETVDLNFLRQDLQMEPGGGYQLWSKLPTYRPASADDYRRLPDNIHTALNSLNQILVVSQSNFGYRAACEMAKFMALYREMLPEALLQDWNHALDIAILQKVLPKLGGSHARLGETLSALRSFFENPFDVQIAGEQANKGPILRECYGKADSMLRTLKTAGYTSFFS